MHRTQRFRILVVDGDRPVHEFVASELRKSTKITDQFEVLSAHTTAQAEALVEQRYVDLVLLTVAGQATTARELLQTLAARGISADVILVGGRNFKDHYAELLQTVSRMRSPRVVDFVSKSVLRKSVVELLEPYIYDHVGRCVHVDEKDLAKRAQILLDRREGYPAPDGHTPGQLRSDDHEVRVEISRLLGDLFSQTSDESHSVRVSVKLRELDRAGLSAAIVLQPLVQLSFTGLDVPSTDDGYDCVLKLGPVTVITEEYENYQDYVRFGVHLDQRVELQAYAARDAIAGIVYSFAGGVYGDDLVSLDELLEDRHDLAQQVITRLFASKHWYSVTAPMATISNYLASSPEQNLQRLQWNFDVWRSWEKAAREISGEVPTLRISGAPDRDQPTVIAVDDLQIHLPVDDQLDDAWSFQEFPYCLVHGDMHGGNVLTELSTDPQRQDDPLRRVCVIDHRHSGPGPRCIDAAAIEWSIRVADAEAIEAAFGVQGVKDVDRPEMIHAIREACARVTAERELLDHLWNDGPAPTEQPWTRLSTCLKNAVVGCFEDDEPPVSREEYIQTMVLYGVRQAGRWRLQPVQRARLCAWLAAYFAALPDD